MEIYAVELVRHGEYCLVFDGTLYVILQVFCVN